MQGWRFRVGAWLERLWPKIPERGGAKRRVEEISPPSFPEWRDA